MQCGHDGLGPPPPLPSLHQDQPQAPGDAAASDGGDDDDDSNDEEAEDEGVDGLGGKGGAKEEDGGPGARGGGGGGGGTSCACMQGQAGGGVVVCWQGEGRPSSRVAVKGGGVSFRTPAYLPLHLLVAQSGQHNRVTWAARQGARRGTCFAAPRTHVGQGLSPTAGGCC